MFAAIFWGGLPDAIPESVILGMGLVAGGAVNIAFLVAVSILKISSLPQLTGLYAKAFAAGAMLTMLADAMMPEAFEHGGNTVGLFTVFGFLMAAVLSAIQ